MERPCVRAVDASRRGAKSSPLSGGTVVIAPCTWRAPATVTATRQPATSARLPQSTPRILEGTGSFLSDDRLVTLRRRRPSPRRTQHLVDPAPTSKERRAAACSSVTARIADRVWTHRRTEAQRCYLDVSGHRR